MSSGLKCSGVGDGNVVPCSGCEGEVGDTTTTFIWEAVKQRKAESRDQRHKPSHQRDLQSPAPHLSWCPSHQQTLQSP